MSYGNWCKYYNGLHSKVCRAGVIYNDVRDPVGDVLQVPCFKDRGCTERCEKASFRTPEEEEARFNEVLKRYEENMKNNICPHCGTPIQEKKQVGRCVYANCGCRLYQGTLPKKETKPDTEQKSLW